MLRVRARLARNAGAHSQSRAFKLGAARTTGVGIRYDLGDHDPRVGTLVKDQRLSVTDGSEERLYAVMQSGAGLFISPVEQALPRSARSLDGT